MDSTRSPLFPAASLTLSSGSENKISAFVPQLPSQPSISTSTLQVYIVPTEKHLFVQGFKSAEFETRPPTLLRGSVVLRVLKPNKIKALTLDFKGTQRTDWPEGIPPKRNVYAETNALVNHSWPFYNADSHAPDFGANICVPIGKGAQDDVAHSSLDSHNIPHSNGTLSSDVVGSNSNSSFAASLIKRATSATLSPVSSFLDLTSVLSQSPQQQSSIAVESKAGTFPPGDYVYNFEHPLQASSPETVKASFGTVKYYLEAHVIRMTTFKSHLSARVPIEVVRIPSDNSVEENEPIVIERDWEDQLRYEIVVASKSVVLDTYLPLSLRFVPLFGKVALHRIRVYITEDCNYYCANKSVHRTEPSRKYLLLEHKAKKNHSLLAEDGGRSIAAEPDSEILPRELEFQMFVPSTINKKYEYLIHPDTAVENIQCTHWIKISLRLSKQDPENAEKRKHYEISIDSPIHLFSPLAAHHNTLLPVYQAEPEFLPEYTNQPPTSPGVTAVEISSRQQTNQMLGISLAGPDLQHYTPRSLTPIQFQHISSSIDNDAPIQRDHDIHLEANLYEPDNDEVLSAIGSLQATAYSPISSPTMSPVRSMPEPSSEPPSFNIMCVTERTLPPAYERENSLMNLSALRLDTSGNLLRDLSPGTGGIRVKLKKSFENQELTSSEKSFLKSNGTESLQSKSDRESYDSGPLAHEDIYKIIESQSLPKSVSQTGMAEYGGVSIDITDICVPTLPHAQNSLSRNSSISSTNYRGGLVEVDTDQTLPLLSMSSSANESKFSVDSGRQFDHTGSMNDLVTSTRFDDLRVPNTFSHFRNPKLIKHYNNDDDDSLVLTFDKSRRKSFGVIPNISRHNSQSGDEMDGSKTTLNEIGKSTNTRTSLESKKVQNMVSS